MRGSECIQHLYLVICCYNTKHGANHIPDVFGVLLMCMSAK